MGKRVSMIPGLAFLVYVAALLVALVYGLSQPAAFVDGEQPDLGRSSHPARAGVD